MAIDYSNAKQLNIMFEDKGAPMPDHKNGWQLDDFYPIREDAMKSAVQLITKKDDVTLWKTKEGTFGVFWKRKGIYSEENPIKS